MSTKGTEFGADEMRDKLNAVSPSFCLAKWMMVSLHLTNGKTQSCYHPPAHDIPTKGLSENPGLLHNTKTKIKERTQMRKGKRPEGCSYCWAVEDAESKDPKGHLSDRHYRSNELWLSGELERIKMGDMNLDSNVTPTYVEVNFNQACNFKCIYCSPHLSTEWQKEIQQHGAFRLEERGHNDIKALDKLGLMPIGVPNNENPYVKAFWNWWPQFYPNLKIFRMTGGEPLIDANTWKVLEYPLQHPNANLELSITSNLCPPTPEIYDRFIHQLQKLEQVRTWQDRDKWRLSPAIKDFMLFVSCDSVGPQAEYIRTGMNFKKLQQNVNRILKETRGSSVSFINTFNILSVPHLKDFLKWILELREENSFQNQEEVVVSTPDGAEFEHPPHVRPRRQRVWFDIPILSHPQWLNIKLLAGTEWEKHTEECIEFMEKNIKQNNYETSFRGFKPFEIMKLKRNLAVMQQGFSREEQTLNEKRFVQYVDELDRRRGTSFRGTFPELESFYNRIKR